MTSKLYACTLSPMSKHLLQRFAEKIAVDTKERCWEWTAGKEPKGYGTFYLEGKTRRVHRLSYRIFKGDTPEGMCVCHRCDNPGCVNPDHLFLGTNQDNVADRDAKGRQARLRGDCNGMSKLTQRDVELIHLLRQRHTDPRCGVQQFLARWFSVSHNHISNVVNGRRRSDNEN